VQGTTDATAGVRGTTDAAADAPGATAREVLVTGGSGQLGRELARAAWPAGFVPHVVDRAGLDVGDADAVAAYVASRPFAAVVNAAAYTAVDRAEEDQAAAWRANALGPAALAQACRAANIPLVHVSTDYVFPGTAPGARTPSDPTGPAGVYGASKLGGELAVLAGCPRSAVVRTAWVVSAHGHNFVKTMLRLATDRDNLRVVDDQRGSPTSAADLAHALVTAATRMADDGHAPTGVFHFANAGTTSWAGFARAIFRGSAARGGPSADVVPIATADYPTPARRPANSLLDTSGFAAAWGTIPRPWEAALDDILDELVGERA